MYLTEVHKPDLIWYLQFIKSHVKNLLQFVHHNAEGFDQVIGYLECIRYLKISELLITKFDAKTRNKFLPEIHKTHREIEFILNIKTGNYNEVQNALLSHKELANEARGSEGATPIMLAIMTGNSELFDLLIENDASLTTPTNDLNGHGITPLSIAIIKNQYYAARVIANRAPEMLYQRGKNGCTPLTAAIAVRNIKAVRFLLELGVRDIDDENIKNLTRINKLRVEGFYGYETIYILKLLKQAKKDHLQTTSNHAEAEFSEAKVAGYTKEELEAESSRVKKKKTKQPAWQLHYEQGNVYFQEDKYEETATEIKQAITLFMKLHGKTPDDNQILKNLFNLQHILCIAEFKLGHYSDSAACYKQAAIISQAIRKSAHPLPLQALPLPEIAEFMQATLDANLILMREIIQRTKGKSDQYKIKNGHGKNGFTPLMHIVELIDDDKYVSVMRCLVEEMGVIIKAKDDQGRTVLHLAAIYKRASIVTYLTSTFDFAAINKQDNAGKTALHYAVENGSEEIVLTLLLRGAKLAIKDKEGKRAEDLTTNFSLLALLKKSDVKSPNVEVAHKTEEKQNDPILSDDYMVNNAFALFKNNIEPETAEYRAHANLFLRAEKILRDQYEAHPSNLQIILRLERFYYYSNMRDVKDQLVIDALKHHPEHPGLLISYGYAVKELGDIKTAKDTFKKALEAIPKRQGKLSNQYKEWHIQALTGLTKIYLSDQDYERIIDCCTQILDLDDNNIFAMATKAHYLNAFELSEESKQWIDQVNVHKEPAAIIARGHCYFSSGEYQKVIDECKAIADDSRFRYKGKLHRNSLFLIARSFECLKNMNAAKKYYALLNEFYPSYYAGQIAFATFMSKLNPKDFDENIERFNIIINSNPCKHAYLKFARFLWYAKKPYDAIPKYQKAANLFPKSIDVHLELVGSYIDLNLLDRARLHCEYFLGIKRDAEIEILMAEEHRNITFCDIPDLYYMYIQVLLAERKISEALTISQQCIKTFKDGFDTLLIITDLFNQYNVVLPPSFNQTSEIKREPEDFTSHYQFPPLHVAIHCTSLSALRAKFDEDPDHEISPLEMKKYFLNGESEAFYNFLVEHKLDQKYFPSMRPEPLLESEIAHNHGWIRSQLRHIDKRTREHRHVSVNELYFIIAAKEVYQHIGVGHAMLANFFELLDSVMDHYQFTYSKLGFSTLREGEPELMGYIRSRANYQQSSVLQQTPTVSVVPASSVASTLWSRPQVISSSTTLELDVSKVTENKF
ncbi:MAG: ankyrin repeat domain-containing protein [Gammaproteobacteria bacterium]